MRLSEGQRSEVQVIVTAEDGKTTKTYTLTVRRLSADDACLSSLAVSPGTLQPAFSPIVLSYECYLPSNVDQLGLKVKTEDAGMKVSMKDGSQVGTVLLSPGHTLLEVCVVSAGGSSTTEYTITAIKAQLPRAMQLRSKRNFECAICCGVPQHPCRIKNEQYLYCRSCLEELTRTSKVDPLTGKQLQEGWMVVDFTCDAEMGAEVAICPIGAGTTVEGPFQSLGSLLAAERRKSDEKVRVGSPQGMVLKL